MSSWWPRSPAAADDLKALKPFIKEYQPVAGGRGHRRRRAPQGRLPPCSSSSAIPHRISTEALRCGAQVVLPADADGHAAGLERIQDLGVGAMTFPAAGSAADLALLLCHHHGASLIVTAGHSATIEEFFDRSRQQEQPVDLPDPAQGRRRSSSTPRLSPRSTAAGSPAGAIALLVLAMLVAVIVALWVTRVDTAVVDWVVEYWNRFLLWAQGLVS